MSVHDTHYPRTARFSIRELAFLLQPATLCEVRKAFGRSGSWWAHCAARADLEGLVFCPGKGPRWRLTQKGRDKVADWIAREQRKAAA